jgi:hypothetical protein
VQKNLTSDQFDLVSASTWAQAQGVADEYDAILMAATSIHQIKVAQRRYPATVLIAIAEQPFGPELSSYCHEQKIKRWYMTQDGELNWERRIRRLIRQLSPDRSLAVEGYSFLGVLHRLGGIIDEGLI